MSCHRVRSQHGRGPTAAWFSAPCVALHCLAPVSVARAIDNVKIAAGMVQQAAKAYESTDFTKAADLYQKAFRLDPRPAYLWALARAEHLVGQTGAAIEHYRQFISTPGVEAPRVPKAQAYLRELEQGQANLRIREAESASRAGNARAAAELYLAASKLAPNQPDLLFRAAVAEALDGQAAAAVQDFEDCPARAPADARERSQAEARLLARQPAKRVVVAPSGRGWVVAWRF